VPRNVSLLDKLLTHATIEANVFGITVPAANSPVFHRRIKLSTKIPLFSLLTLPAVLFLFLCHIILIMIIAWCKLVCIRMLAMMKPDNGFNARHSGKLDECPGKQIAEFPFGDFVANNGDCPIT